MQEFSIRLYGLLQRLRNERGGVSIEYVGIVAFVGVLALALLQAAPGFSSSLVSKITSVISSITGG